MLRSLGLLAVGVLVGFALGWVAFGAAPRTPKMSELERRAEAAAAAPSAPTPTPIIAAAKAAPRPIVLPAPLPADAPVAELRAQVAELRGQLERLNGQLREEQVARSMAEGTPVPPPATLPARFQEAELRRSLEQAIKEAGLAGTITSVDCTEYPCIVFGDGFGNGDEHERLAKTAALQPYAKDGNQGFGWSHDKGPDGKELSHFGVALYPEDDKARRDEIRKRTQYRVAQMQDAGG